MGNVKIEIIPGAVEKLRKLPAIQEKLLAEADRLKEAASEGGQIEGFETAVMVGRTRARASVTAVGIDAQKAEAVNHALLRALGRGR